MTQNSDLISEQKLEKPLSGKWVFVAFSAFFAVVIAVNSIFITQALKSHSGLVTEDAYKKGLAYNEALAQARNQPEINANLSFHDGVLTWTLNDETGAPIENASVQAHFIWRVKTGNDFKTPLYHVENGAYSATPNFPVKGSWQVKLSAQWNNTKTFKMTKPLVVKNLH